MSSSNSFIPFISEFAARLNVTPMDFVDAFHDICVEHLNRGGLGSGGHTSTPVPNTPAPQGAKENTSNVSKKKTTKKEKVKSPKEKKTKQVAEKHTCEHVKRAGDVCEKNAKQYLNGSWYCGTEKSGCYSIELRAIQREQEKKISNDTRDDAVGEVHASLAKKPVQKKETNAKKDKNAAKLVGAILDNIEMVVGQGTQKPVEEQKPDDDVSSMSSIEDSVESLPPAKDDSSVSLSDSEEKDQPPVQKNDLLNPEEPSMESEVSSLSDPKPKSDSKSDSSVLLSSDESISISI